MTRPSQVQEKREKLDVLREFLKSGPKNNSEMVCHLGITLARLRYYVKELERIGDVVIEYRPNRTGKPNVIAHITAQGRGKQPAPAVQRSPVASGNLSWWQYMTRSAQ